MINSDLEITDLDENAILGAVREGIRNGRLPETTIREEIPIILKKFGLLHDGKLNNAAAVLFGKDLYGYPQCLVRMARFKGTTKEEFKTTNVRKVTFTNCLMPQWHFSLSISHCLVR